MSFVFLANNIGSLLDTLGISIAGNYGILTMFILIGIFILSYIFGREYFALLATSLAAIGMGVWNSEFNRLLMAMVAVVFGFFIVMLIYRVTNK